MNSDLIEPSTSSSTSLLTNRRSNRLIRTKFIDSVSNKSKLVQKTKLKWKERKQTLETMGKLKKLVPTVPKNEQVTRIELLQHVIDYIFELQRQLNDPTTPVEDREL